MRLVPGLNILLHGRGYEVRDLLEGGALRLWDKQTGREIPLARAAFDEALFEGNLETLGDGAQLEHAKRRAILANIEVP